MKRCPRCGSASPEDVVRCFLCMEPVDEASPFAPGSEPPGMSAVTGASAGCDVASRSGWSLSHGAGPDRRESLPEWCDWTPRPDATEAVTAPVAVAGTSLGARPKVQSISLRRAFRELTADPTWVSKVSLAVIYMVPAAVFPPLLLLCGPAVVGFMGARAGIAGWLRPGMAPVPDMIDIRPVMPALVVYAVFATLQFSALLSEYAASREYSAFLPWKPWTRVLRHPSFFGAWAVGLALSVFAEAVTLGLAWLSSGPSGVAGCLAGFLSVTVIGSVLRFTCAALGMHVLGQWSLIAWYGSFERA